MSPEAMSQRRILAICVPDLPLQRIERERGAAAGGGRERRPLAIIQAGRILQFNAVARAAGVRSGDSVVQARAVCAALEVATADPDADRAALEALAEAMLALAPAVEIAPPDALLLDASGAHLAAGDRVRSAAEEVLVDRARALAAELGYVCRAAVASGPGLARALARHGSGRVERVGTSDAASALAQLPLLALEPPTEMGERLLALGVRDVGALARLPLAALAHRFGAAGAAAARLARGVDETPLVPFVPRGLPEERLDLEAPVENAEPLLFVLSPLADRVASRLAGRALGATRLELKLRLDERGEGGGRREERLVLPLARPSAVASAWLLVLRERLAALVLPAPVVGIALAAVEAAKVPTEQLALDDRPKVMAALEMVLARLAARLGEQAIFAAEPVDRHRPEAAYRPAPFTPGKRERGRNGAARISANDPRLRRADSSLRCSTYRSNTPVLLAPRAAGSAMGSFALRTAHPTSTPTPTEKVPAIHGRGLDGADRAAPTDLVRPTRLLSPPRAIVAEGEGGRLTALRIDGHAYAVLAFVGPERLSGEWWCEPFDRDYYQVRLEGLGDCWIYRDGADGRLYLHGFFD